MNENDITMSTDKKLADAREKAISWVKGKGFSSIKASFEEDFEDTHAFVGSSNGDPVVPDITAQSSTGKSYFEIAQKTSDKQALITKWKLLSRLATMKNGQFVVFAPYGHKSFAERIVENNRIQARIIVI